jgi:hypothetical protein
MQFADTFKTLAKFISIVCLMLFFPALYRTDLFSSDNKEDIASLIKLIKQSNPDYIFIGNSMLDSRINPDHLYVLTGKKSFLLWRGGVETAVWYLMLKNLIIPSGVRPQAVFIFFRDTFLTEPQFRTEGVYRNDIRSFSMDNETVLDGILRKDKSIRELFAGRIGDLYPILENKFQEVIANISEACIKRMCKIFSRNFEISQVNTILNFSNFRHIETDGENIAVESAINYNFTAALPGSFLPRMIKLAKENHVPLVFIRVQRRPVNNMPPVQSPVLKQYVKELADYLKQENMGFYDFTGDPRITLDMYGSGDHIDKNKKKLYTEFFADTLKDMLK